ncbi:winged helix DNA-binding domain-containing protein [Nitriliruptoraceae bacterium ZYF776]|nr:winged helix DNA-binding domain-containing protein [Profundirhabdus halotolerans]
MVETSDDAREATRAQVLAFRHDRHQLGRTGSHDDAAVLDTGVQDTGGPDAARWALAQRGRHLDDDATLLAWTLRGAPHAYRRAEAAEVAAAVAPLDDADAAKRIFDAAKPLREAGITASAALARVAEELRDLVTAPRPKGEVSSALTARLPDPYLRWCRPCQATHAYEQTFRLAALQAGLELVPGTAPAVLRPLAGWDGPAATVPDHLAVVRGLLRRHGPSTPKLVAQELDAPVRTVKAHWPDDVVPVQVDGARREVLADDLDRLLDPPPAEGTRLLGAFDPWLQVRDRELLVAEAARRQALWPVLGRPGAVLVGGELVGTWRPRSKGAALQLFVERWDGRTGVPHGVEEQAEALAAHRGQRFAGFADV